MKRIVLCLTLLCTFVVPSSAQDAAVSVKFNKSLESYYALKNALATDQPEAAQKLAASVVVAVKEVPHKGFATDAQHQLWMQESALISQYGTELAATADLDAQRKAFREIGSAFVKLADEFKINNKKAFIQYCPMGKYTWLSEVKEVQNPFYGSKMYDCGEVKGTISKK